MAKLQSQAEARRKLAAATRPFAGRKLPPALFLTDPRRTKKPAAVAARLPPGWGVVFRHFGAKDRLAVARALAAVCRRRRLVLLISADPALARAVGADGVHWPEARLSMRRARHPRWIETASAHSRVALVRAARMKVDAVILSTVFDSRSDSAGAAMGALRFRQLVRASVLPVYALGGITPRNAARTRSRFATIDAVLEGWA